MRVTTIMPAAIPPETDADVDAAKIKYRQDSF